MSKKNYLCIQRSQPAHQEKCEAPSPSQMEEMYAKFNDWREKYSDNLVDMGGRLGNGKLVTIDGPTDGPFIESKEVIGGYMIVSADGLEEAMQIASECPGVVRSGSAVDVREIISPPAMPTKEPTS